MKKWALLLFITILAGCSGESKSESVNGMSSEFPPIIDAYVVIDDTEHEMEHGGFEWHQKKGLSTMSVQTDHASIWQMAESMDSIQIDSQSIITFKIEGQPEMEVFLWNDSGRQEEITLNDGELPIPEEKGRYVYEVYGTWENGNQSFAFILEK